MFSDCWTIVDQVHVLREILSTFPSLSPETAEWLQRHEAATILRNRMDHLKANIPNLAKAKGNRPPLFGALTYFVVPENQILEVDGQRKVTGGDSVLICSGSSPSGLQFAQILNPLGETLRLPASLYRLEAFGHVLELEAAIEEFRPRVILLSERLAAELGCRMSVYTYQTGTPCAELWNSASPNLIAVLTMEFE